MKVFKTLVSTFLVASSVILAAGAAQARSLTCTSVGDNLPANKFDVDATLQFGVSPRLGEVPTAGTFKYKKPGTTQVVGTGQFTCADRVVDGVIPCALTTPDANIVGLAFDALMGLAFQLNGQKTATYFSCK